MYDANIMKKSSRFYLKYNPDNRWSFWTGKWWSLCSEISGQFTPKLGGQFTPKSGGQFDRIFQSMMMQVVPALHCRKEDRFFRQPSMQKFFWKIVTEPRYKVQSSIQANQEVGPLFVMDQVFMIGMRPEREAIKMLKN